jgi:hypothetical protein
MLKAIALTAVIILALTGVTLAAKKKATAPTTISGEVVSIDASAGTLTVKDSKGKEHKVKPTDPKELDQLTVGDKVTVERAGGKTTVKKQETSTPAPEQPVPTPQATK